MIRRILARWRTPRHHTALTGPHTIHVDRFAGGAELHFDDWVADLLVTIADDPDLLDAFDAVVNRRPADPYGREELPVERLVQMLSPRLRVYGPRVGELAAQLGAVARPSLPVRVRRAA